MSFFRIKRQHGRDYVYEVESYREEGRVRQRVLRYVGPVTAVYGGNEPRARAALKSQQPDPNKRKPHRLAIPPWSDPRFF